MATKVFWQDPYLTELDTIVQSIKGNQITLKDTIFYAFSGGQESDQGTIGGHKVLEAKKDEKEIFYTLDENHGLNPGDSVKVVLELVCQKFPEVLKVGAHIAQDKSRIDFEWDQNISPFLPDLQQVAQSIINSNQEIISAFSDETNERRYWKINEFSQVP